MDIESPKALGFVRACELGGTTGHILGEKILLYLLEHFVTMQAWVRTSPVEGSLFEIAFREKSIGPRSILTVKALLKSEGYGQNVMYGQILINGEIYETVGV